MRAVNLIPANQRASAGPGAGRSGGGAYFVLGLLGGLAVLALLYGLAAHKVSSRSGQAASLTARAQQAQARATQLAPYVSFAALREQRVQAVDQLVDSRFDWAHAFHELGRVLPASASITSLNGTIASGSSTAAAPAAASPSKTTGGAAVAGAAVASATPPGTVPTFALTGCATNQAAVALTLDRLRLMDGVSEVTLQSSTKSASSAVPSGGSCATTFSVQVTFDALPSVSAASPSSSSSKTVSASGSSTGVDQ